MGPKKLCPHCGASMMRHRHSLSRALVQGLSRLAEKGGGPINIKLLNLTRNQWDNFQKLRYWDLVAKHADGEGNRKGGVWRIMPKGEQFLQGRIRVPKQVWTYRGERVEYEEEHEVAVTEVIEGYRYYGDYATDATPHEGNGDEGQKELF